MDPKRTLLVLILLMTIFEVRSQEELPDIIPPAPEASSIGKFSEVPVSHYTGVPNISIPIASYDLGDRSFPVSLKYHARGIKVAEIASRVGIGWALSAGGRITRQIRMKPDDLSSGDEGYLYGWGEIFDNYSDITPQNKISLLDELDAIDRDKLPDMYTLRTPELSTKFIFDYKNGNP